MDIANGTTTMGLVWSTSQIIPLAIFCFIVTTLGLFGNSVVLYSSLRYNAIKLDKISLTFVQNLAIADILYTLMMILPITVTYMAGRYVLGEVYCFVTAHLVPIPSVVNTLTILVLTVYRVRVVSSPFSSISPKAAYVTVALIWGAATPGTILSLAYKSSAAPSYTSVSCISSVYVNQQATLTLLLVTALLVLLPLFAVTLCNVVLCVIAVRHSERHNTSSYRALLLVCSLSGLFLLSWAPYIVYTVMKARNPEVTPLVDLLAFHCIFLNSCGNPILYTLTNRRFGGYVKGVLGQLFCRGSGWQGTGGFSYSTRSTNQGLNSTKSTDQGLNSTKSTNQGLNSAIRSTETEKKEAAAERRQTVNEANLAV